MNIHSNLIEFKKENSEPAAYLFSMINCEFRIFIVPVLTSGNKPRFQVSFVLRVLKNTGY